MTQRFSRRTFIQMSSAGLVSLGSSSLQAKAAQNDNNSRINDLIIINALGGISNQNLWVKNGQQSDDLGQATKKRIRSIDNRAIKDTHDSGTTAINVTLGYIAGPEDPFEYTVNDIAAWNAIIRQHSNHLLKAWSADDIIKAKKENKTGIIFGFQNAQCVGNQIDRVNTFANLGVKIIQLTYNARNQIGDGSAVTEDTGLTPFGVKLVEALNENNVLVDLSHSSQKTCLDALSVTNTPITISHTGCRALNNIPRNKTDKELRLVAESGGVVGIYFMPFLAHNGQARATDVVRHIEHALNVCGEDHVGIGTDGDATTIDDMPAYRQAIAGELRQRKQAGVATAGESNQIVPLVPDLMGPTQFQKLAGLLRKNGHSSTTIEKILGGNFLRLMREVW